MLQMDWNFDEIINREGTACIKYDQRQETFGKSDVLPMWVADMDFRTPPFIIEKLKKRIDHEILGYSFRTPDYYDSISSWLLRRHNWKIENDWICFCPGIVPALNLCTLAYTRPGDSIIVQPPVYMPFFSAAENHGRNLVYNKLIEDKGIWKMDFDSLRSSINESVKMIILSNPHNPVGRAWKKEELEQLAQICIEKNVLILSDEIHCDLVLPGYSHTPMASISEAVADITVTCIAPSKTFNLAGLATSSLVISNPVLRKYFNKKIGSLHLGNGNIFGNIASVAAYTEGDQWLEALLSYLAGNVEFVKSYCREFIPEIIPVNPEATYMIWLDCRKLGMKPAELQSFFVGKAGIGMNEGSAFGPGGEGFMRMNLGTPRANIEKAMEQIRVAIESIRH